MEVDISEPRSKAFSIFLRYFHLGISLLIAQLISTIANEGCTQNFVKIGLPISYILIGLNLISILIIRCKQEFNRKLFFIALGINIILAGVSMVVGFGGIGELNSCANNKVLHKFAGFFSFITMILTPLSLLGQFDWSQRYLNCPGNLTWVFLFLGFAWTNSFKGVMITIGIFYLLISIASFVSNVIPFFKGITSLTKKIISGAWMGGLATMALCEILGIIIYLASSEASSYEDMVAKKLLQTFFPINIIDGLFWIWGILTLRYSRGDSVRQGIMEGNEAEDDNDLDQRENGIGTIQ